MTSRSIAPARTTTTATRSTPAHPAGGAKATKLPPPCSLTSAAEASSSLGIGVTAIDSSADIDPDQISCTYLEGGTKPVFDLLIRAWSLSRFDASSATSPYKSAPQADPVARHRAFCVRRNPG